MNHDVVNRGLTDLSLLTCVGESRVRLLLGVFLCSGFLHFFLEVNVEGRDLGCCALLHGFPQGLCHCWHGERVRRAFTFLGSPGFDVEHSCRGVSLDGDHASVAEFQPAPPAKYGPVAVLDVLLDRKQGVSQLGHHEYVPSHHWLPLFLLSQHHQVLVLDVCRVTGGIFVEPADQFTESSDVPQVSRGRHHVCGRS
eukprot:185642-Rhodomonas_salina.1